LALKRFGLDEGELKMATGKRRLTRNKLILSSVLAVFLIFGFHGVFFRKGRVAQAPVFGICSDASAGASEGLVLLAAKSRTWTSSETARSAARKTVANTCTVTSTSTPNTGPTSLES